MFIGHFLQKSPIISGCFAKMTCNSRHPIGLCHPVSIIPVYLSIISIYLSIYYICIIFDLCTHVHVYVYMYVCVCIYIHICVCKYSYVCVCVFVCVCVCVCVDPAVTSASFDRFGTIEVRRYVRVWSRDKGLV